MAETTLIEQINAAFDYRGHVTLTLKQGDPVVGYLYNRALEGAAPYVELVRQGDGAEISVAVDTIEAVELTGQDHFQPFQPGVAQDEA
jgi:hypothetical protein